MPTGHRRRKADPKHAKKLIEGGKRAKVIRKKADEHHAKVDVPAAEDQLLKDLEGLESE